MLQKMYKNGEETMPSSEEYMEHLFKEGWSLTPPAPPPNLDALPDDLPLRDLLGGLTLPQVKALFKKLNPKMLDKIKEALR